MNAKNRLIDKLLKVAKKHKILTYPVLALVAVISVFSYFFSWSTGAGKRVVAIVMVMVMLVSQSYFLTSSATALVDTEETMKAQRELQEKSADEYLVDDSEVKEQKTEAVQDASEQLSDEKSVDSAETSEVSTETITDPAEVTEGDTPDVTDADTDTEEGITVEEEEVPDPEKEGDTTTCVFVAPSGGELLTAEDAATKDSSGNTYTINSDTFNTATTTVQGAAYTEDGYYAFEGWYTTTDDSGTKITADNLSGIAPNKNGEIWLYARRKLVKYKVTINTNGGTAGNIAGATKNGDYYDVLVNEGGNTTFTITNPQKEGYQIKGITSDKATGVLSGDENNRTVTVALSGETCAQTITYDWKGDIYSIAYAQSDEAGADAIPQNNIEFDGTGANDGILYPSDTVKNAKPGYEFKYWQTGIYTEIKPGTFIKNNPELQSYLYSCYKAGTPAVLKPYYEYNGVELNTTSLTYQYRIPKGTTTVTGRYTNNQAGADFEYAIKEIKAGETTITADTLKDTYGIIATASTRDGILVQTDSAGPKKVSTNITITVIITDLNVAEDKTERTSEKDFSVVINQCPLSIVPSATVTKQYDGTTDCSFSGSVPTNIEGVKVNVASSVYDKADAGNRKVILTLEENWLSLSESGDDKENYTLVVDDSGKPSISGIIDKRPVWITTKANVSGGRGYVRAGESSNPEFEAVVVDKSGTGFLTAEDKANMYNYIELYTKPARDDSALTAENSSMNYEVWAKETEGSNYKFMIDAMGDGNIASFTVKLESPTDRYEITGDPSNEDWYGSAAARQLRPLAGSGYDRVRISGNEDWAEAITLTEENTENGKVTFQLMDTATGAYTSWKTISVKVDLEAPEYVDYSISQKGSGNGAPTTGGLFFPSEGETVSFGNYFNKTVKFSIRYRDNRSNPGKLCYTLTGTLGGSAGEQSVNFGSADASGLATAEFEILADAVDKIGTIQFYAEDKAGNKESPVRTLTRNGDEWAVETTGPSVDPLVVKSGEITVVDGSDNYYANCVAQIHATDSTSGIYGITWYVNENPVSQRVSMTDTKVTSTDFSLVFDKTQSFFTENGEYTVYAIVSDNAGNQSKETNSVTFKVDDVDPVVDIVRNYDTYQQNVKLEFSTYDELSGIRYINVKDVDNNKMLQHVVEKVEENEKGYMTSYCYVETSAKGKYTIEVCDKAGNIYTETIILDKVSNEVPACPEVTLSPELNENGWITDENAKATITNVTETVKDKTEVQTKYRMWKDGETPMNVTTLPTDKTAVEVSIPDGIYKLHVWSESRTGVKCAGSEEESHTHTLQVDTKAPVVSYELQKGSGSNLIVSFKVTDEVSGVDGEAIQVMHGAKPMTVSVREAEDGSGYVGSFEITEVGNYSIIAKDIAGNASDTQAFTPMSMKVNAVKNITQSSATIGAIVYKGTYDIQSANISYRKYADTSYVEAETLPVVDEDTGNYSVSAVLNDLEKGTPYVYRISATSESGEVLEYEGYFRTLSDEEKGITIIGSAKYVDGRAGSITVGLFEGNSCIRAVEVDTEAGNSFTFDNVPDGNYSIVATDGVYSKTVRVLIADGVRIYPESDSIDLVLSGKNTSVVITTDDTPDITADNLDSLFDDITNFTDEEKELIDSGAGTVEFKLFATLMKVSSVGPDAIAAMYSAASNKDKIVGAYLDLSLYKIVTDGNGDVTRTRVKNLAGGANVSITIPLDDLAGKPGLEVIRIHQDGDRFTGAYLVDRDSNPATYTIQTEKFSTYAILYDIEKKEEPITTEEIKDGTSGPASDGSIYTPSDNSDIDPDDEEKDDKDNKNDKKDKEDKEGGSSSVGTLRSSGSAKTGDSTPIAILFGVMILSLGGVFVLRKKTIIELNIKIK